jgi:4-hydroxy-3-polyprenylbenzoate decarboxylase
MSYYRDLREWLETLDQRGKLVRIKRRILKETELFPLFRLQYRGLAEEDRKAFLFENVASVKGRSYAGAVGAGVVAASREIFALGMMCSLEELNEKWARAQMHPIEPVMVSSGPVQEEIHMGAELEELGMDEFPVPVEEPGFSGSIRTTTHFVTKDVDTGIRNVGNYSGHIMAPNRIDWGIAATHHGHLHWRKAREQGKNLEVAIVIGATPNLAYASMTGLPYGVDEYGIAGSIAGAPLELVKCKTVDLEVPASAEIVAEGQVRNDVMEPMPSFGDYPGYVNEGTGAFRPVIDLTAITHRKNPIFTSILVGFPPSENHVCQQITTEVVYHKFLKHDCNIPGVLDVAFHQSGGSWNYYVIQLRKTHASQPWQALNCLAGYDPGIGKIAIAVDDDINPRDPDMVNWALSFRMQPDRDVKIITGKSPILDPSGYPPGSSTEHRSYPPPHGSSAMLVDATRKWAFPPVALPRKEYMEHALKIWEEEGLPALKLKKPWYGYTLGDWSSDREEEADLIVNGDYKKVGERYSRQRKKI